MTVSYRRLSPLFQFSLPGVTLVYISQWFCLSTLWPFSVCKHIVGKITDIYFWYAPERRYGSTRVPGHGFLALRSSWRMVVYIYHITAAGNSVSSQLGSSCHLVRATGTVRKRQPVRPVHHVQNHTWRVTPLQPARLAAVLGQPSSLWPHWYAPLFLRLCTLLVPSCVNNFVTFSNLWKKAEGLRSDLAMDPWIWPPETTEHAVYIHK